MRRISLAVGGVLVAGLCAQNASATYHTFKIDEIYSNPSGTVQFIEMHETANSNFENALTQAPDIKSTTHDFVFPSDLPTDTANKFVLLGTAGYASIPGVPAPNYTIPASFFNPAGDTLQYGTTGFDGTVDLTTFGALPSDPTKSLNRTGTFGPGGNTYDVGTNSPTNFAGATGSVPEPSVIAAAGLFIVGLGTRRRRRRPHRIA